MMIQFHRGHVHAVALGFDLGFNRLGRRVRSYLLLLLLDFAPISLILFSVVLGDEIYFCAVQALHRSDSPALRVG